MDIQVKETIRNSYNKNAKIRDQSEMELWKVEEIEYFISTLAMERPKVLDLGAGTGQQSSYMVEKEVDITCIDLSPEMIEICLQKGLPAYEMDFYTLDFEDQSFDGIWAMNTLLHVPKRDLTGVLKEVRRVLKPGGTFYMGVYGGYNSEGIWEDDSYYPKRFFSFYEDVAVKEQVAQVFELQEFRAIPLKGMELHYQALLLR